MTANSLHIAVVAMSGIFPGARDTEGFIRNIMEKQSAVARVPSHRWIAPVEKMVSRTPAPDRAVSDRAGLVTDFSFDPHGFDLPPGDLAALDPVHQFVLQAGRTAVESCAVPKEARKRTGVILAAIALPTDAASEISFEILCKAQMPRLTPGSALNASVVAAPAALLTKAFGFGGGSYTLDAACASSLFSIKLACDRLCQNKADIMIAGGVSRPDSLYTQVGFSQLSALSPSGICAPFDRHADGLVVGEGCGILVLKRLGDALACNDTIHAVIKGVGLSNDIEGNLVGPASEGQVRAMTAAYEMAGWTPDEVQYMECHGSGTPVGDKVETRSIRTLLDTFGCPNARLGIGSVKSNIGHLLTAAGAAGFIKTVLAMNHGTLPPSLHFNGLPGQSPLRDTRVRVQAEAAPWVPQIPGDKRKAAVSAFGFGGINAHVLLEEFKPVSRIHPVPAQPSARRPDPVAIVGMDTRTRDCEGVHDFFNLVSGRTPLKPSSPLTRWQRTDFTGPQDPVAAGAFMDTLSLDIRDFHIPPNQIDDILPQHLVALKAAKGALEDAGIPPRPGPGDPSRTRMGAAVGIEFDFGATDFYLRWKCHELAPDLLDQLSPPLTFNRTLGALGGIVASRAAREFQLGGPCFTLSAGRACGMRAIEIAQESLSRRDTDIFLCTGVDMAGDVRQFLLNRAAKPHDQARPSEGAAAVVLKRLEDAVQDKDRIYGVIREVTNGAPQDIPPKGDTLAALGDTRSASGLFTVIETALSLYHGTKPGEPSPVATAPGADDIPVHCQMDKPPAHTRNLPGSTPRPAPDSHTLHINTCRKKFSRNLLTAVRQLFPDVPPQPRVPLPSPPGDPSLGEFSPSASSLPDPTLLTQGTRATARAHEKFLDFTQANMAQMETQFAALVHAAAGNGTAPGGAPGAPASHAFTEPPPLFTREHCMEFAVGRVGNVLGPSFDIIDTYPVRVRLPDAPLMLVHRIMAIEGEPCSLGKGRIVTQHDVEPLAWYLDGELAPVCISIEAGQADLFLCSYLGIDHAVKGTRKYRLLDARVTFHRSLPGPGETIEYHIEIDRFLRQGDVFLFFFHYNGFINQELFISMRDGCAGFFTDEEVKNSGGIILKKEDTRKVLARAPFSPLVSVEPGAFSDARVDALRTGDLEKAFGKDFAGMTLGQHQVLPGKRMHLIDRVLSFDPTGGRFGLGSIVAQADIRPDHWFLTCHFIDDRVMPGTLMYECCAHALRIFVQRMGWVSPRPDVRFNVLAGNESDLKCRGPVTPATQKARYEVEIKEMGYRPEPYVIADAHMFSDDLRIVLYKDMGMILEGLTLAELEQFWRQA